jgi:hypothetical protein
MPDIASMEGFKSLDSSRMENSRPVFIYITSTHEDLEEQVQTFETTVFTFEKFLIALKFFDTYKIDLDYMDMDDPILKVLDKPKPMSFYTFYGGKQIFKSKERPSAPKLFSLCKNTYSKVFKDPFNAVLKKEERILDGIDKIMKRAAEINEKLDGNVSEKEEARLEKEMEQLAEEFETLEKQEKTLFESAVPKQAFVKKSE